MVYNRKRRYEIGLLIRDTYFVNVRTACYSWCSEISDSFPTVIFSPLSGGSCAPRGACFECTSHFAGRRRVALFVHHLVYIAQLCVWMFVCHFKWPWKFKVCEHDVWIKFMETVQCKLSLYISLLDSRCLSYWKQVPSFLQNTPQSWNNQYCLQQSLLSIA